MNCDRCRQPTGPARFRCHGTGLTLCRQCAAADVGKALQGAVNLKGERIGRRGNWLYAIPVCDNGLNLAYS